ncbi:MAG: hypothetical protein JWQ98_3549 [Chlorobi bacterium]|nr:hypothetical protein [Chlorobiota bacterium]
MVLTKDELLAALNREVHILLHLAGKVEESYLDYRPTPGQRSTLELIQYLTIMGRTQIALIKNGVFNMPTLSAAWGPAVAASKELTFEQAVAAIRAQPEEYRREFSEWADEDFRRNVDMFGSTVSRGALLVSQVLGVYAAYRTQLFCYLKSCGRTEMGTINLWAGMDAMAAA